MSILGFAIAASLQAAGPAGTAMPPMPEDLNEIPIADIWLSRIAQGQETDERVRAHAQGQ